MEGTGPTPAGGVLAAATAMVDKACISEDSSKSATGSENGTDEEELDDSENDKDADEEELQDSDQDGDDSSSEDEDVVGGDKSGKVAELPDRGQNIDTLSPRKQRNRKATNPYTPS